MCECSNDLLLTDALKIIIVCGGNIFVLIENLLCVYEMNAVRKEFFHWHRFDTEIFLGQRNFVKNLKSFRSHDSWSLNSLV